MKILIIILILFISGCSVSSKDIKIGEKLCKNNEGIHHISTFIFDSSYFYCNDGAKFNYSSYKGK